MLEQCLPALPACQLVAVAGMMSSDAAPPEFQYACPLDEDRQKLLSSKGNVQCFEVQGVCGTAW